MRAGWLRAVAGIALRSWLVTVAGIRPPGFVGRNVEGRKREAGHLSATAGYFAFKPGRMRQAFPYASAGGAQRVEDDEQIDGLLQQRPSDRLQQSRGRQEHSATA